MKYIFYVVFLFIMMECSAMFSGIIFWDDTITDKDLINLDKTDVEKIITANENIIYMISDKNIVCYYHVMKIIALDKSVNIAYLDSKMGKHNNLLFSFVADNIIIFSGINRIQKPPRAALQPYDEKFIKLFDVYFKNEYSGCNYLMFSDASYYPDIFDCIDGIEGTVIYSRKEEYDKLYQYFSERKK